jgi:capsular polysaccharide biosynthesis protein
MKTEPLFPASAHKRTLPFFGKLTDEEKVRLLEESKFDALYKHSLTNAYISPFGLVFKNGWIVKASIHRTFNNNLLRQLPSFYKKIFLTKKIVHVKGNCLVVSHSWYDNYYHWFIEIMPRLFLLKEETAAYTLLIHANLKPFHKEILAFFNFKEIVFIKDDELAYASSVTFPSFNHSDKKENLTTTFSDPAMNKLLMQNMSKWIVSKTANQLTEKHLKIYISREKALYRKVLNEKELTDFLMTQGFAILYFEEYEFWKQVQLMQHAKIVIGLSGAGLSNILFMQKGSHVINFSHINLHEFCFYNVANCMDVNYAHILCQGNQKANAAFNDIVVNVADLKAVLEQL